MLEHQLNIDYTTVTELPGAEVTTEQLDRCAHRYFWAGEYCRDKDVLEVACGVGQGLGYLASVARSVCAGDITPNLVNTARAHYGDRLSIALMDAQRLPVPDASLDVVILFEAIYYLPSPEQFVRECRRVLRAGGRVLLVTANKDLYDFNPSPYSHRYLSVPELRDIFRFQHFACEFFGVTPVEAVSSRQKLLRPLKFLAVKLNLIPKTMSGKTLLKRLVFGRLQHMPAELQPDPSKYFAPARLDADQSNYRYKVIYLAATLTEDPGLIPTTDNMDRLQHA